jgi:hypothetical protein
MNGAIPPLPQHVFMAWCLVKHRDNFTFTFICLGLIGVYNLYRVYGCLRNRLDCIKAITNHPNSRNVVNIKIHTSNESLSVVQEDLTCA